eukprot:CAMPEP_0117017978 /NCGR_PEP_ID=MMETSP0472-20121206/13954_1 /TAXON_ID=693140 ORGANISM="Tiarina fusus, Strain LIS" /NCGR_SAMPLE_ID=MMETSP0472 /ASSEMBLY_ACC=CAM_ASM_000603 /LENGTH=172 /DNA_ID=CAMNT_0004722479 /DNA_START=452 /DNA_END=970 /DNA_ORIENTATION=-
MATPSLNPMYYLRHAWDATHSTWGKLCIVLFYLFIWLQIIWAVEIVIFPTRGWECMSDGFTEYAKANSVMLLRGMNILTVGFYLYADRGGIKVWNVAMVFLVNLVWSWPVLVWSANYSELEGAPQDCEATMSGMGVVVWVLLIWSFVALVCAGMEKAASPRGSAGETAPLNV